MQSNQSDSTQPKNQSASSSGGTQAQQPSPSYVDDYQPPVNSTGDSSHLQINQSAHQTTGQPAVPIERPNEVNQLSQSQEPVQAEAVAQPKKSESESDLVADKTQDKPAEPIKSEVASAEPETDEQSLETQNIFVLLGVTDSSQEEKEAFLDELQQVVWEDFLEHDLELLITQEEKSKVDEMLADSTDQAMQEELVIFLEKLIPDLEEIVYEKALELKSDMVEERIAGMKEYYQGSTQAMEKIDQAEKLIEQGQWRSAAEVLNAI